METTTKQPIIPERAIAATMTASSETMEDFLAAKSPPVRDGDLEDCFEVFGAEAAPSLLTITGEREAQRLVHIRPANALELGDDAAQELTWRDLEAAPRTDAGWISDALLIPNSRQEPRGKAYRIRAFKHQGRPKASYALVHFKGIGAEGAEDPTRSYVEAVVRDDDSTSWQPWKLRDERGAKLLAHSQSEIMTDASGRQIIYGKVEGPGEHDTIVVVLRIADSDEWLVATSGARIKRTPYTYRIVNNGMAAGGTLMRFGNGEKVEYQDVRIKGEPGGPVLDCGDERWQSVDLGELVRGVGELAASRFLPVPGRLGCFIVHEQKAGHVWLVTGFGSARPEVQCLTQDQNRPARLVQVGIDRSRAIDDTGESRAEGTIILFIVDRSDQRRLWVKREALGSVPAAPRFDAWVQLGNQTRVVAVPRFMPHGAEVFLVNEDSPGKVTRNPDGGVVIERKTLCAETGQGWRTTVMATHSEDLKDEDWRCATHTTHLTLLAKDGSPAYRAQVDLTSPFPCTAVINGVSRHLRPDRPIRAFADGAGQLHVKTRADTVDGPVLRVSLGAGSKPIPVPTTEAVARRLAGREKHAVLTAQRMTAAKLLPEKMTEENKKKLLSLVCDTGEALGRKLHGDLSDGPERWYHGKLVPIGALDGGPGWTIQDGTGAMPTELAIVPTEAADEEIMVPRRGRVQGWGFLGDVLNWLVETAEAVAEFSVKLVGKLIDFVVKIGNKIFKMVIDTSVGLARGLEALFQNMARAVGQAVDAARQILEVIKVIFDLPAILRTNDCLKNLLQGGLATVEGLIGDTMTEVTRETVDYVVKRVNGSLKGLESYLSGSLGQVGREGIPDSAAGKGFADKMALINKGGVQARWAADKVTTHREKIVQALNDAQPLLEDRVMAELKKLSKLAYDPEAPKADSVAKIIVDLAEDLKKSFQNGGMEAFDLVKFLQYCERIVDLGGKVITSAVNIVLGLVADAFKALRALLDTRLDIPGITQFLGRAPSLLDLLTFVPAVAITAFWKVCTFGRGEVAGAGLEPFPVELRNKLLKDGPFPENDTDAAPAIANFMLATYRCSLRERLGQPLKPEDEKVLREFVSEANRGTWRWLAPVTNCLKLAFTLLSATAGAALDAIRDWMNIVEWNSGTWVGRIRTLLFTLPNILLSVTTHVTETVKGATIKYFPDSEDGKRWKQERDLLPPWDWPSLSWLITAVGTSVGFVALNVNDPAGVGLGAYSAVTLLSSAGVVAGTVIYTVALIIKNSIEGKPIQGWRIANELGTILGGAPSLWTPAAVTFLALVNKAPPVQPIVLPLAAGMLLINGTITLVAGVVAAGNIISDATIKGWGFPANAETC